MYDRLGGTRISDIRRSDLQLLIEQLVGEGFAPSTVQSTLMALYAIFRREVAQGRLAVNPALGLHLPAIRGGRDRIADPREAAALLKALPLEARAVWATALYAGLRRGELQALDWSHVDLAEGIIHVERSWDEREGFIEPKSAKGWRKVPTAAVLRGFLLEHRLRLGRSEGLVFGRTAERGAVCPGAPQIAADKAWKDAELGRITLREARHTFASLMIAAGVNAKALSTYMGHANINLTLDKYGHLMPGNEEEAADLRDAYLERASAKARKAQIGGAA